MNFGGSDVIKGIELAHRIYQIAFTYENRADVRYHNFRTEVEGLRDEIQSFESLLKQLKTTLVDSHGRYRARTFSNRAAAALDPLSHQFEGERCVIIGNFNATLEECQRILEEKRALSRQRSNALVNAAWYLQTQPKVDELRKRLHFHTVKILLVIDRLSFKLLTDLDANIVDLLALSEENLFISRVTLRLLRQLLHGPPAEHDLANNVDHAEDTHFPSHRIAQRFEQHFIRPGIANTIQDLNLVEGFDTLLLHYDVILGDLDESKEAYLTLLKVRWLIDVLKRSHQFARARPGFYYKRAVHQLEQAIASLVRDAQLTQYDEDSLMALPELSFAMWPLPQESATSLQDPSARRANEEEVVRLKLGATGSQSHAGLAVFRSSDTKFRLVLEEVSAEYGRVISTLVMQMNRDRLIPRYALPTVTAACFDMAILSHSEEDEKSYRFGSEEDLFSFQQALTGYAVSHDQPNIECQFSKDSKLDCQGRIQLWQDPIILPESIETSDAGSNLASSPSSTSNADARSRHSSIAASISPSTMHCLEDGLEAGAVKLSAMMIYTSISHRECPRYAMIFFELEPGMKVMPERCKCAKDYEHCPYIVLERSNGKRISLRVSSSRPHSAGVPNPNTFDLLPFRLPRCAAYRELPIKETSYVLLKFKSLEAKKKFHHELNLRVRVREQQQKDQEDAIRRVAMRENRPTRNVNQPGPEDGSFRRRPSYFEDELPPQIEKLELNTPFEMHNFTFQPSPVQRRTSRDNPETIRPAVSSPARTSGVGSARDLSNMIQAMAHPSSGS